MDSGYNSTDSQKRADCLLLIQAQLYGQSGNTADKAKKLELSIDSVSHLMEGHADEFSLSQLIAIARKAGITARI